jgi:Exportin-5 family
VHVEYRLEKNWHPIVNPSAEHLKRPLTSVDCQLAGTLAAACNEKWFSLFYARSGVFVGDLDFVTAEAVVDKCRVELSRTYSDVIQAALALKGDWALVLANYAKEEGAIKKNDPSLLMVGPRNQIGSSDVIVNADGTPKQENQSAIDSRKLLRINKVCEFFLLENEQISYPFLLTTIRCLNYPDAYTVRRCTKICHRILETVAWSPKFTPLIANHMFTAAVTNIVTEPKWMVGIEWDMINVVRDIYCRLVLGQVLQFGGQGPAQQQPDDISGTGRFEQAKSVREPLKGGGILSTPTTLPRELLARLPDISENAVMTFEENMQKKRSAKDQKDFLRDILRVAAEKSQQMDNGRVCDSLFGRADGKESLLMKSSNIGGTVSNLPEKLVTQSMVKKREQNVINESMDAPAGLAAFAI